MKKYLKNYGSPKSSKLKMLAVCIKAVTGVAGGSLILAEGHPYLTLAILCVGAVANEVINFYPESEPVLANELATEEKQ